jgi:hypothetical protein
MTLLEILFATMILGVGLISVMAVFPLGVERHIQSVQDEKSAIIVDSLKDAVIIGARYPYASGGGNNINIIVVHDGMGEVIGDIPEGRAVITLPRTARALDRDDDTGMDEGFDIKYETNDPVRYPDRNETEVYRLAQILLKDDPDNRYFNNKDDLSSYSFDIEIREAVTVRRPRTDPDVPGSELTDSRVRVYELASRDHETYEFTIRIYRKWKERSQTKIALNRENARLVRVYSFAVSLPQVETEG